MVKRFGMNSHSTIFGTLSVLGIVLTANCFAQSTDEIKETLTEPPVISSRGGVLTATLKAERKSVRVGSRDVLTVVYNGLFAPPTLRLKPRDVIKLTLINALDKSTNFHTHGLAVSPLGNSDNVFIEIPAGTTFDYEIRIPRGQSPGTYWYHPHFHGLTSSQVGGGMSGALIIEGALDKFPAPLRTVKERIILLKDVITTASATGEYEHNPDVGNDTGTTRTVNGQVNPIISISPGETQYWRIANVSANIYYLLKLDGHTLFEFAQDGNLLNRIVERQEILLPAASRRDVFVRGAKSGVYQFRTLAINTGKAGNNYPEVGLATVVSQGRQQVPLQLPTRLPPVPDMRKLNITNRRTITFSESDDPDAYYIDGKTFDHHRVDTTVKLGSVEEWSLVNASDEMHTFHIHQLDFQVTELNGKPVEFIGYQDNVNMPSNSTIKIILPFTDPVIVGKFVYHCHILRHEDKGMMATIVVEP